MLEKPLQPLQFCTNTLPPSFEESLGIPWGLQGRQIVILEVQFLVMEWMRHLYKHLLSSA